MTAGTEVLAAWPPAAVATVVGSLLALAGTGIGVVWSTVRWRQERDRNERAHRWAQVTWAIKMICAGDVARSEIGARAVDAMYEMQIPGQIDDPIARVVVKFLVEGDDHVPDPSNDGRTSADP